MAHSHDQTLIARMGFSDPDRKNPLHEEACRYLAGQTGSEAVAKLFCPKDQLPSRGNSEFYRTTKNQILAPRGERERTISKGSGSYRSTVGFLDAVIHFRYRVEDSTIERNTGQVTKQKIFDVSCPLLIEVKVEPVCIGQVLRQINFYRDFINDYVDSDLKDLHNYDFVLATCYRPSAEELETLEEAFIRHLYLGRGFKQFLEKSRRASNGPIALNEI